jgi:signal transduction histidine kinase
MDEWPEGTLTIPFNLPLTEDPFFIRYYESRQNEEDFWVHESGKEEMASRYQYMRTLPVIGELLANDIKEGKEIEVPSFLVDHVVNFSNGNLIFITYKPCPEGWDIFKRFGKVFEQTYTRFLDLQKAEVQAREAQIELGLERVRARAMAMQRSEELKELIGTVFTELTKLELVMARCLIMIFDPKTKGSTWWMANSEIPSDPTGLFIQYHEFISYLDYIKAWQEKTVKWIYLLEGETKKQWDDFLFIETELSLLPGFVIAGMKAPDKVYLNASFNSFGNLTLATLDPLSNEHFDIMLRFAKVFDLTYTRFNDLKQVEAQAREAKIEAALERTRTQSMIMQHSKELDDTLRVFHEQVQLLGINSAFSFLWLPDEEKDKHIFWAAWEEEKNGSTIFKNKAITYPLDRNEPATAQCLIDWKSDEPIHSYAVLPAEVENYFAAWAELFDGAEKFKPEHFRDGLYYVEAFMKYGCFGVMLEKDLTEDEKKILGRFSIEFERTFTRFLDLQKAEGQAKEAKIETALERVRSKTMAMHNSQDVGNTVAAMFDEVVKLGIETIRCGIGIMHEGSQMEVWTAKPGEDGKPQLIIGRIDMMIHPLLKGAYNSWSEKKEFYTYELADEDLRAYFTAINDHPDYPVKYDIATLPTRIIHTEFYFTEGTLFVFSLSVLPEETRKIFKRFANVFGQTYRRYLDLKKAEAQAKEAQIEASLERVRSKAMAMQKADDLANAVAVVFEELNKLNLGMLRCGIGIHNKEKRTSSVWSTTKSDNNSVAQVSGDESLDIHPLLQEAFEAWLNHQEDYSYVLEGEDLNNYYKAVAAGNFRLPESQSLVAGHENVKQYYYNAMFSTGSLFAFGEAAFTGEAKTVLRRFADVFDFTYTRFNDLQLAEAQAREATIEAALEKVRGKAMAMHNSNDLSVTASLVFTEFRKLGINPIRCGVGLLNKESRKAQLYSATSSTDGDSLSLVGWVELSGHPVLEKIYDTWLTNKDYYPELQGEQLKSYYELLLAGLSVTAPDWQNGKKQYGSFLPFSVGCLYAWSEVPYNDAEIKILKRFATIIDLTFRRYIELQTSEASAKETVKQAVLDRIRADIASMRTIADLDRITPLIWNELTILGIPFIRCGVFIMDDAQQFIHTFLSTPDGKAIAAFHIPYASPGNVSQVLTHWRNKKNYIDHWDESAFTDFANTLVKQGGLVSSEQYLKTIPHGGFYLHFLPFLQGMLYVGNTTQLGEEEIKLIQSIAAAFSTAYARYEDFNKLEAAKQQVDKTLVDLRQTQQQLVQSEKMASLGELTAGIAHEIQNPLNFVNNFSEVSKELLDEMKAELDSGNMEDAKVIANDIIQNLEKINHHGKRADAIVKGMLQHSRSSSATKELTDINALADEYIRLCYHGLRAKDKSFNATIQTDFDTAIKKIEVVPQDIGRVILNLLTNAFYAVNEKKKLLIAGYEPTVSVNTQQIPGKIEIRVSDNGNGIPQKVLDKIFQPFFTTKPTGQGTGLGLSLSYDIITKGHEGELKVETKEGESTTFIIQLLTKEQ